MTIRLYDISVANYLQGLRAAEGFLDKGLAHCREHGIDPEAVAGTRLHPDMLPFRYQVHSTVHHSAGAMAALQGGTFAPDRGVQDADYAALQKQVADARASLETLTPEAVNALEGRDVVFQAGERKMAFTAADFVLSFSLPNFYFHATTAYDILRQLGVPVGKRDFMGMPRLKR